MSDILWGALLGGGLAILGGVVQGYFSNKNTKHQINAREEEQIRQFEFDRKEHEKEKLITARSQWIKPLYETLLSLAEIINQATSQFTQITYHYPKNFPDTLKPDVDILKKEVDSTVGKLMEMKEQFTIKMAPVSDDKLKNELEKLDSNLLIFSTYFITLYNAEHTETIKPRLEEIQQSFVTLFTRIEELSCGVDR